MDSVFEAFAGFDKTGDGRETPVRPLGLTAQQSVVPVMYEDNDGRYKVTERCSQRLSLVLGKCLCISVPFARIAGSVGSRVRRYPERRDRGMCRTRKNTVPGFRRGHGRGSRSTRMRIAGSGTAVDRFRRRRKVVSPEPCRPVNRFGWRDNARSD